MEDQGRFGKLKKFGILIAVKPVMMIYGLQLAITGPVSDQLWINRTCNVNLGYNVSICEDLSNHKNFSDEVQKQVTQYKVIGSYIENVPQIVLTLYLGPLSDRGRKLLMYIPFLGHLISGGFYLTFIYFNQWPAQYLWIANIYVLFGGYAVLQIAMYGYIGDVTTERDRTTLMSILQGIGIAIIPLAKFLSGVIYDWGGFYAVYGFSFGFTVIGLIYICFIPESLTEKDIIVPDKLVNEPMTCWTVFKKANQSVIDSIGYVV